MFGTASNVTVNQLAACAQYFISESLEFGMRILLVEDDQMVGRSICTALKIAQFTLDWVNDGIAAEHAIACENYSLLLLDLGLPRKSGWEILKFLRQRGNSIPVLILTARDAVEDRILGLNLGADDYLVKPFNLDELIARMRALLRRNNGQESAEIVYGALSVDTVRHEAQFKGEMVNLSAKEFAMLYALMEKPGAVLSRDKLEERIYGWGDEVASNTVQVHIHNLRKKLGADVIQNVRGVGYRVGLV